MLEQLWDAFLELTAQLLIPDWGFLVGLLPLLVVLLVGIGLIWTFRRLLTAAPARRGVQRVAPRTPPGIHMPGPSLAPILAAIGTFLLLLGLVFGGISLALGAVALVLTLLYWLAEGLRIYDHEIGSTTTTLPARVSTGPPAGVHMPGPSFRPILGALGMALLLLGLVFGGWLLAVGVIALIAGLVGWLPDARHEYLKTVEADRTGHLESMPAPRTPGRLFATLAVLVVAAAILQSGLLTTGPANGGTPGSSGSPGSSAAPPPASGEPSGAPSADVTVEAKGIAFLQASWSGPAETAFTIAFDNQDPGTPHNIELRDSSGASIWKGEIFEGPQIMVYDVPPLAAGAYTFICSVHPNMTGTATLQ